MELADWRAAANRLSEPQFAEAYPTPALLLHGAPRIRAMSFDTILDDGEGLERAAMSSDSGPVERVCPLVKTDANPYADRISVGRTANCDIVIESEHVSKLHAHFRHDEEAGWTVTDLNSSNGTGVNGRLAPQMTPVPLADGDYLQMGPLRLRFVKPHRLHAMLRDMD